MKDDNTMFVEALDEVLSIEKTLRQLKRVQSTVSQLPQGELRNQLRCRVDELLKGPSEYLSDLKGEISELQKQNSSFKAQVLAKDRQIDALHLDISRLKEQVLILDMQVERQQNVLPELVGTVPEQGVECPNTVETVEVSHEGKPKKDFDRIGCAFFVLTLIGGIILLVGGC